MPTTSLVPTAPPADRAAPRKLASQQIAKSATPGLNHPTPTTKAPKPVPGAERARIRSLEILAPPPASARPWRLCAPCTIPRSVHKNAQTKAPHRRWGLRITPTNYHHLRKIGFDPQKTARNPPHLMHAASPGPETKSRKTAKPATRPRLALAAPDRTGSSFFRPPSGPVYAPAIPPAPPGSIPRSFAARHFLRSVHKNAQAQIRRLPLPRINRTKNSRLSRFGFVPQKAPCERAGCASAPLGHTALSELYWPNRPCSAIRPLSSSTPPRSRTPLHQNPNR